MGVRRMRSHEPMASSKKVWAGAGGRTPAACGRTSRLPVPCPSSLMHSLAVGTAPPTQHPPVPIRRAPTRFSSMRMRASSCGRAARIVSAITCTAAAAAETAVPWLGLAARGSAPCLAHPAGLPGTAASGRCKPSPRRGSPPCPHLQHEVGAVRRRHERRHLGRRQQVLRARWGVGGGRRGQELSRRAGGAGRRGAEASSLSSSTSQALPQMRRPSPTPPSAGPRSRAGAP